MYAADIDMTDSDSVVSAECGTDSHAKAGCNPASVTKCIVRGTNFLFTYYIDPDQVNLNGFIKTAATVMRDKFGANFDALSVSPIEEGQRGKHVHVGVYLKRDVKNYRLNQFNITQDGVRHQANVRLDEDVKGFGGAANIYWYCSKLTGSVLYEEGNGVRLQKLKDGAATIAMKKAGNIVSKDSVSKRAETLKVVRDATPEKYREVLASGQLSKREVDEAEFLLKKIDETYVAKQYEEIPVTYEDEAWECPIKFLFNPRKQRCKVIKNQDVLIDQGGIRGLWVYGPSRTGKSEGIKSFNYDEDNNQVPYYEYPRCGFLEAPYCKEQIFLIDDITPMQFTRPSELNNTMDRQVHNRKHSHVKIDKNSTIWVVTSNAPPEEIWDTSDKGIKAELDAVLTRMFIIKLETKKVEERNISNRVSDSFMKPRQVKTRVNYGFSNPNNPAQPPAMKLNLVPLKKPLIDVSEIVCRKRSRETDEEAEPVKKLIRDSDGKAVGFEIGDSFEPI